MQIICYGWKLWSLVPSMLDCILSKLLHLLFLLTEVLYVSIVYIATASLHYFCASGVFFITWYLLPFFGSWFEFGWAVRWGECPLGSASPPSHSANLVQGVNPPPCQPPLPKPNKHSVFQAKGHFCDFSGENLFCIFTQHYLKDIYPLSGPISYGPSEDVFLLAEWKTTAMPVCQCKQWGWWVSTLIFAILHTGRFFLKLGPL